MKVLVLQSWQGARLADHWPGDPPPEFADLEFEFEGGVPSDEVRDADHVIVLNGASTETRVRCPPDRVWALMQEPPTRWHRDMHRGQPAFSRIYTSDVSLSGDRYRRFWGALEWHVGRTYDELRDAEYPRKTVDLAWVTSNASVLPGHRKRMHFLERLIAEVPVELWGRGIRPVASKWDALSPARYSIAFENHARTPYWSEKITDCFLAYSTPVYYGSNEIDRYFPKNSYIDLNPDSPDAVRRIKDILESGFHEEHLDDLLEARERCLTRYNTLFFVAGEISSLSASKQSPSIVTIGKGAGLRLPWSRRVRKWPGRLARRLLPPSAFYKVRHGYRAAGAMLRRRRIVMSDQTKEQ